MGDQGKPGSPQMGMEQYHQAPGPGQVQVSMAMSQAQLPTLAPAPPGHSQPMHGPGGPVMHNMPGPGGPQPNQPPQLTMQQSMGQPQFQVIQQPQFNPSGQYATFPQFATYNQQGQLVLQPMMGPGQQPGQVILSAMPQKPGQPQMISAGQPQGTTKPGAPGQPNYTITSSGIQAGQPTPQTFIMAPSMGGPGMAACPVSMNGQMPNQTGQVVHTSMGNKAGDSKPGIPGGPPHLGPGQQQNPQQPQFVLPPGMAYMQPGPQQIIQNGQIIFRASGPQDQPLMFSPTGQPGQPGPPTNQPPHIHQANLPPQGPNQPMQQPGQMTMPGQNNGGIRPPHMPTGAPPGKTAISRAIAPLLPTVTHSGPRQYLPNGPGQPSPKSKQKMSPRGLQGVGPGRPPGSKAAQLNNQAMKVPRIANPLQQPPHISPLNNTSGSPKPPMLENPGSFVPTSMPLITSGPPTLTPMMFPTQPTTIPPSVSSPLATSLTTFATMSSKPSTNTTQEGFPIPFSIPTSAVAPTPHVPLPSLPELGPPTLTKEINNGPPMPNLGPPQLNAAAPPQTTETTPQTTQALAPASNNTTDTDAGIQATPKAVVKPNVLTHVIDGHKILESSQPFPMSPSKTSGVRRKSEKDDKFPAPTTFTTTNTTTTNGTSVPVKRGPGRPPGSTNNKQNNNITNQIETKTVKNVSPNHVEEPPEKRQKINSGGQEKPAPVESQAVAPLTNGNLLPPAPNMAPCAPLIALSPKNNPLKWNVQQVCDFIKGLPGCSDYVEDFALQEIDGQALMLLQADHLMTAMSIKLGPALKICEQVKQLKDDLAKN